MRLDLTGVCIPCHAQLRFSCANWKQELRNTSRSRDTLQAHPTFLTLDKTGMPCDSFYTVFPRPLQVSRATPAQIRDGLNSVPWSTFCTLFAVMPLPVSTSGASKSRQFVRRRLGSGLSSPLRCPARRIRSKALVSCTQIPSCSGGV